MAFSKPNIFLGLSFHNIISMFSVFIPFVNTASFNYPDFISIPNNIDLQGTASFVPGYISLTNNNTGRAVYSDPVRLWDKSTGEVADFTTHFSFSIQMITPPDGADGLAFFLSPNGSLIPPYSGGELLGLYNESSMFNSIDNPIVAVEFDTYQNQWDPISDHVGIDVNSIDSVAIWNITTLKNGSMAYVWISYNSSTQNLSVYLTFDENHVFNGESVLSYVVDLKSYLPEWITVGFSAATGSFTENHNILSWEFNSTEFQSSLDTGENNAITINKTTNTGLVIGLAIGLAVLVAVIVVLWFLWSKKRKSIKSNQGHNVTNAGQPPNASNRNRTGSRATTSSFSSEVIR